MSTAAGTLDRMAAVVLHQLVKTYPTKQGPGVRAVDGIDLEIASGEFMVLVGPSGCGKSTTLRMIAGLEEISGGTIAIDGQVVVRPMMYVALTYDHRIIDGREAVQFLVTVKQCLEDPARMVLGL